MSVMQLQDPYLNGLRKEQIPVSIYLINGIKLSGIVSSFDQYVVILNDPKNTVAQLIYKHAISTIVPTKSFINNLFDAENKEI